MTYEEILCYIDRIPGFAAKHSGETVRHMLDELGAPDDVLTRGGTRILHVAGTNGKGSVCNYLSGIARAEGLHAGVFYSPHLVDIRERMRFDEGIISREEFASCFERVYELVKGRPAEEHPSYFEFLFLMGMVWFGGKKPDVLILETGLGGEKDATNCVRNKAATVITRIGLDHMSYLGNTVEEIAHKKAGIFESKVPAVVQDEPAEALEVFRREALKKNVPLYVVSPSKVTAKRSLDGNIDFSMSLQYDNKAFGEGEAIRASLKTKAMYQKENAALAVTSARVLGLSKEAVRRGLEESFFPGRMEEVSRGVYLDGGHNPDGIRAFLESVKSIPIEDGGRRFLLFSAVRDKQYDVMARMVLQSGLFTVIGAAPMEGERGLTEEELLKVFRPSEHPEVFIYPSAEDALTKILQLKKKEDLVFAAGSLYFVGILKKKGISHDQV